MRTKVTWIARALLAGVMFGGLAAPAGADPYTPDARTDVPSSAGSVTADAFVSVSLPTLEALLASAQLAGERAANARLRAFARREDVFAEGSLAAFAERGAAVAGNAARNAAAPTLDGLTPLAGIVAVPYGIVADTTQALQPLVTPLPAADQLRALGRTDVARLAAQNGEAFDAVFADVQLGRLERLVALDKDFILNGDDPRLRSIAVHDLPRLRALAAELRRLARG